MMYLRHEAGHAFNYAYRLYATPEWRELFGPFNRRYRDDYRPVPFSPQVRAPHLGLVRAEASRRGLRRDVRGVADAALGLAATATRAGPRSQAALRRPRRAEGSATSSRWSPTATPTSRSRRWSSRSRSSTARSCEQNGAAVDLASTPTCATCSSRANRRRKDMRPAAEFMERAPHRADGQDHVLDRGQAAGRAGAGRSASRGTCRELRPPGRGGRESACLVELTAYGTTLAMNYLTRGKFVLSRSDPGRGSNARGWTAWRSSDRRALRLWWDEDEERAAGARPKKKRREGGRQEIHEALKKPGTTVLRSRSTARARVARGLARLRERPRLQPDRVLGGDDTKDMQRRRLPRAARAPLHRRRPARPLPRAGQGARQEDLRLPRHPHALLRDRATAAGSTGRTTSSSR